MAGQRIVWDDEMRLDLWHTVRKVWAPRGVAVTIDPLRVVQPPYASELNPVEHFFWELHWALRAGSIRLWRPSRRPWSRS